MNIGFIGLGTMGAAMSANIIKKHPDPVFVYDVDPEKVHALEELGAKGCKSSREAAALSDLVITMVPRSEDAWSVWKEMLWEMKPGKTGIDMSTIDPDVSVEIADMVKKTGAEFADCPVVKSKAAAIAGTLGIFAGCSRETLEKIRPVLLYMGDHVLHMGDNGKGITMKICQNALSHEIQAAVNETLTLAQLHGISVDAFAAAVSFGGAKNYYLESKYEAIRDGDYTVAFPVEYAWKDLNICSRLSEKTGFEMPVLGIAVDFLKKAMDMGLGKADNCACIEAVRSGTILEKRNGQVECL